MGNIPIALQLFAVRGEVEKDLAATLQAVADLGYVGAEPWGYGGDDLTWMGHQAQDIRKMYDDAGLACCGFHLLPKALEGDNLARTIEMNEILGNRFLIIAMDKQRMGARDTIMELAALLNDVAEQLKPKGMYTGYHAHGFDAEIVDGERAWDILFANTNEEVIMQMDIGNYASGGGDPIATLKRFTGRARSVHLKDYGKEGAVIGEGLADWDEVFRLCENEHPTEWYVVEECGPEGLGYDIPRRALENLRKMGK